jgi:hypothetical protein
MPVQNIGMVFTYNKPKTISTSSAFSASSASSASSTSLNAPALNRSLNIGMVQRIKRNTISMTSIMYNVNHKCSSCGT